MLNSNYFNLIYAHISGSSEMSLKWIDDTHCLGIFANSEQGLFINFNIIFS
jgi:hypothetical protein